MKSKTHAILDATPDAILGLDEQCRVTLINPAATSIFGVQARGHPRRPIWVKLLPQLDRHYRRGISPSQGMLSHASQSRMARLD
jgi:PAS domain-containing protein